MTFSNPWGFQWPPYTSYITLLKAGERIVVFVIVKFDRLYFETQRFTGEEEEQGEGGQRKRQKRGTDSIEGAIRSFSGATGKLHRPDDPFLPLLVDIRICRLLVPLNVLSTSSFVFQMGLPRCETWSLPGITNRTSQTFEEIKSRSGKRRVRLSIPDLFEHDRRAHNRSIIVTVSVSQFSPTVSSAVWARLALAADRFESGFRESRLPWRRKGARFLSRPVTGFLRIARLYSNTTCSSASFLLLFYSFRIPRTFFVLFRRESMESVESISPRETFVSFPETRDFRGHRVRSFLSWKPISDEDSRRSAGIFREGKYLVF